MNRTLARAFVLSGVFVLPAALAGCGEGAYKRGVLLLDQGNYDAAVVQLNRAVDESAGLFGENEDYVAALGRAKRQGAAWHYEQAREAFEQTHLHEAADHVVKALQWNAELPGAEELLGDIHARIRAAWDDREAARRLAEGGQWDEAVARMHVVLERFETMPGGADDLARLEDGASAMHLSRARRALSRDAWDAAEREARTSLDYRENDGARAVLAEVTDRRRADRLVAQADELFEAGNYRDALDHLHEAHRLHEQRQDIPPRIHRAKDALCDELVAQADALHEAGRYGEALDRLYEAQNLLDQREGIPPRIHRTKVALCDELIARADEQLANGLAVNALHTLRKCNALLPGYEGVAERAGKAKAALAARHLAAAEGLDPARRPAAALLHYLAAIGYGSQAPAAQDGIELCRGALHDRTRYAIAVVDFGGNGDLAARFEDRAVRAMLRARPANVTILNRAGAALGGADAAVSGQVSGGVTQDQTVSHGTTEYRAGTKLVPNPEFDEAVEELGDARRDLRRAVRNAKDAVALFHRNHRDEPDLPPRASSRVRRYRRYVRHARDDLRHAEFVLSTTPTHVARPRIVTYRYPIYDVELEAEVSASVQMIDAATGEVLLAETIRGHARASDRYVEGEPERNVPGDPLDLPDPHRLRDRAADEAVHEMEGALEDAVDEHGRRFAILARRALDAGRDAEAAEHAVGYLFAYPHGAGASWEMLRVASGLFANEADLVPLANLLRAHCNVQAR
jgi:tetratricopeptide (TPR) repeat protein